MLQSTSGALAGVFSVNDSGKKVHFSQGNLFYDGSEYTFEPNQYSFGELKSNHLGYFFWSGDPEKARSRSDGLSKLFTNYTVDTPNPDFTVYGEKGKFRTLSSEEWQFLFTGRYNASNLYSNGVNVCGKLHCIVIAPDECGKNYEFNKDKKNYTSAEWTEAEEAGLVCLPPAGIGKDGMVLNPDYTCYYWTSSAIDGNYAKLVDCSYFNDVPELREFFRTWSIPIRLVTDD